MNFEDFKTLAKKLATELLPGVSVKCRKYGSEDVCWCVTVPNKEGGEAHFQMLEREGATVASIEGELRQGLVKLAAIAGIGDNRNKALWLVEFHDASRQQGRSAGSECTGVVIVEASDLGQANQILFEKGIRPPGMPRGNPIPPETAARIPKERIGVLMDKATADGLEKELLPAKGAA